MKLFRRGKRIEAPVTAAAQGTASGLFPPSTAIHRLCCARTRFIKALWRQFP